MTMGRVTANKLIAWVNAEFQKLEIKEYEVFEVYRTHYRSHEYEAGAAKLVIRFRYKPDPSGLLGTGSFLCFYSMQELSEYLKLGYRLYLKSKNRNASLSGLEIDVTKN